ncbi:hypothetical protein POTOM_032229 [Populus tomentosa]|uniref:Uncharacterized protein n=1 Tax=Populus tomentosa TaxID=118781 RepID=A0A8X7Z5K5_POPTO|nr:hypothetical protein POTOM_032229 [Populus tomentosa]
MELLKLSKFKLQLQALAIEVGGLREREQSATEQCRILIQKQKQTDEEYRRQLQELQSELASSNELHQKLQRKVSYLQNDNALLEDKHKDLKGTIQSLLQSKESFVNSYQESTCEMKRSIEAGDRKLIVLSEKINSHLSLFDSIEREALSIKQLVDKVKLLVSEKEGVGIVRVLLTCLQISVAGLRSKMDKVSAFENVFVGYVKGGLFELVWSFERSAYGCMVTQIGSIEFLMFYNQALHCEVGGLAIILQRIQETVVNMNHCEDRRLFSSLLECQGDCDMVVTKEDTDRIEDLVQNSGEPSPNKASSTGTGENRGFLFLLCIVFCYRDWSCVTRRIGASMDMLTCSPLQSPCSELHSAANGPSISVNNVKVNCTAIAHHLDSESSTTQAETSQDPC